MTEFEVKFVKNGKEIDTLVIDADNLVTFMITKDYQENKHE